MRLLAVCSTIFIASVCTTPIADPDFWWHLVVGRWILAHQEVPWVDNWNFFAAGSPWIAYSWLVELFFAIAERVDGGVGFFVLQFILAMLLGTTLVLSLSRLSVDSSVGVVLGLIVFLACAPYFALRPQVVSWICCGLLLLATERIIQLPRLTSAIPVFLIFLFWSNTNITSILGLFLAGFWLCVRSEPKRIIRHVSIIGFAYLLGAFATPYGVTALQVLFAKWHHPFSYHLIEEFQQASLLNVSFLIALSSAIGCLIFVWQKSLSKFIACSVVLFILTVVSFLKLKFVPFYLIFSIFLLAAEATCNNRLSFCIEQLLTVVKKKKQLLLATLSAGICLNFLTVFFATTWYDQSKVPKRAWDFIETHDLAEGVFAGFNEGGYLIYRLSDNQGIPRAKVVLDGRTNLANQEVLTEYFRYAAGLSDGEELLSLVNPQTVLWRRSGRILKQLKEHPEWCMVYAESEIAEGYAVYLRRSIAQEKGISC